jgi:ribonuclease BN (tRNA processing enzyme)
MIKRIFHSIGQGAFYSERHEQYNIVYDCGEWKDSNLADKVVKQSFLQDERIDILFISHFDYDHVSKISTLKNHVNSIDNVILPLLHPNEKILLLNIYKALDINIIELINNPQEYFGQNTKIIYVKGAIGTDEISIEAEAIDIKTIVTGTEIESGTAIFIGIDDWIFIPYNHEYLARNERLEKELAGEGFNVEKLKTDNDYSIEKIVSDIGLTKRQGGKKLKEIYERLEGNINQNSMLLYSGTGKSNINEKKISNVYWGNNIHAYWTFPFLPIIERVGCIYSGDADFNITNIHIIFDNFFEKVGTIQIPHHGDLKMFNSTMLDEKFYYCPISFGNNNSYGHPSGKVISEILAKNSLPLMISEKPSSEFIQIINEF